MPMGPARQCLNKSTIALYTEQDVECDQQSASSPRLYNALAIHVCHRRQDAVNIRPYCGKYNIQDIIIM